MESIAIARTGSGSSTRDIVLKALLFCGMVSSLLYVASDAAASIAYTGYSYAHQAFSELLAIGSPVRQFMIPLMNAYNLLVIAFGAGVWLVAGSRRSMRVTGALLFAYGLFSAAGPFVPMHARGTGFGLTDVLHIGDTVGMIVSMLGFIAVGAFTLGKGFRLYSAATFLAIIGAAAGAFRMTSLIAAGLPTPWVGLVERVNIYAMLLWVGLFSLLLLTSKTAGTLGRGEVTR